MSEKEQFKKQIDAHIDAFERSGDRCDYDKAVRELKTVLECLNEKMDKVLKITEKLGDRDRSLSVKNISNETH